MFLCSYYTKKNDPGISRLNVFPGHFPRLTIRKIELADGIDLGIGLGIGLELIFTFKWW